MEGALEVSRSMSVYSCNKEVRFGVNFESESGADGILGDGQLLFRRAPE